MTQTIEQLWGANFRGGPFTDITSSASQWAGRTTIDSGSTTVVVSTQLVNSDSLILMGLQGTTTVNSDQVSPVEVKTISPGGHLTFGTQGDVAVPRDTTIMWLLVRTSAP